MKTIIIGNVIYDQVYFINNKLIEGEKVVCDNEIACYCGGQAANVAQNLSCLGINTTLVGMIGNDKYGRYLTKKLKEKNVSLLVPLLKGKIRSASSIVILNRQSGERTIVMNKPYSLTQSDVKYYDILQNSTAFIDSDICYFDGYELSTPLIRTASKMRKSIVLNLEYNIPNLLDIIMYVEHIITPFNSLKNIIKYYGKDSAMSFFNENGFKGTLVVTNGSKGSYAFDAKNKKYIQKAYFAGDVIDTTGAGDAFSSGYLYGLNKGCSIKECLKVASQIASVKCSILGPNIPFDKINKIKKVCDLQIAS